MVVWHLQQMNVQYCVSRPLKILIKIKWRKMKPPSNIRTKAPHVIIDLDFGESKFGWSSHWHMSIKLQLEACMILDAVQILSWRQDMIKYDGRGKIYLFFSSTVTSANSQKWTFTLRPLVVCTFPQGIIWHDHHPSFHPSSKNT